MTSPAESVVPETTDASAAPGLSWALVVPLKRLHLAKSRLELPAGLRAELALAMAADTVAAALTSPLVRAVFVVTAEVAELQGLLPDGVTLVPDSPAAGLNGAISRGTTAVRAAFLDEQVGIAACCADLPALREDELRRTLAAAAVRARTFVADRGGDGTTLVTASPGLELLTAFGAGSRLRHKQLGLDEVGIHAKTVRCDVDTLDDLGAAATLGVGQRTSAVLDRIDLSDAKAARGGDIAPRPLLK